MSTLVINGKFPDSLYNISLRTIGWLLSNKNNGEQHEKLLSEFFSKLAIPLVERIMITLYENSQLWDDGLLGSFLRVDNISSMIIKWDVAMLKLVGNRQKRVKELLIGDFSDQTSIDTLTKGLSLLSNCLCIDFDGELFWRGKIWNRIISQQQEEHGWLHTSQTMLRLIKLKYARLPKHLKNNSGSFEHCGSIVTELHLGEVRVDVADIKWILKNFKCLEILKNYKLVETLYDLHVDDWKSDKPIRKYLLKNLDADFSYVGRWSSGAKCPLRLDALKLATEICDKVESVNVRFDCSTHYDILQPLLNVSKLKHLSLVCVSNGERSLLNFEDISTVIKHHGPRRLRSLELKVIEKIDVHEIINNCGKLENLVVSCCSYPPVRVSSCTGCFGKLPRLTTLLYVESQDDFCNNNYAPQCFWMATLSGENRTSKLKCLCLKSPRIQTVTSDRLFRNSETNICYPKLEVLTLADCYELNCDDLMHITTSGSNGGSLQYLRLSQCESLTRTQLEHWREQTGRYDVTIEID